jgi:hypothetical protein
LRNVYTVFHNQSIIYIPTNDVPEFPFLYIFVSTGFLGASDTYYSFDKETQGKDLKASRSSLLLLGPVSQMCSLPWLGPSFTDVLV